MKLTLAEKHAETDDVISFVFEPSEPVSWLAGQFITLHVPHQNPDSHGISHYFTIASAPYEKRLQITTRLTGSTFKAALNGLAIGSQLNAEDPEGDFVLAGGSGELVFLAAGIGITPFRSILRQAAHEESLPRITLLYANRTQVAVFSEELATLAANFPSLSVHYLVEPERISAETIKRYVPETKSPTYYLSGPEPMVEALEAMFPEQLGVPIEQVKRDYFPNYDEHNF